MRRAKRRLRDKRMVGVEQPRNRMDPRHLKRLVFGERRQDSRQPPCEHRLSCSGRAAEQKVVSARSCELQRATGSFLAAHVGKIERGQRDRPSVRRHVRLELELAAEIPGRVGKVAHWNRLDACERGLVAGIRRTEQLR
jgi:hypothetical protein